MVVDEVVFMDSEVEPIVGRAPSSYSPVVMRSKESERAPIVVGAPTSYDSVVTFEEPEVRPIIGCGPTSYASTVSDRSEKDHGGGTSVPYTSVVFDDSEIDPILGRFSDSPYQAVTSSVKQQPGTPMFPVGQSGYRQVLHGRPGLPESIIGRIRQPYDGIAPKQILSLPDSAALVVIGGPPRHEPTSHLARVPLGRGHISFELSDAWDLPRPSPMPAGLTPAQLQVMGWLEAHRYEIADAERRRRIDRRAIAAAIAWEALENVWPMSWHAVGPGKVHLHSEVVRQVEAAGYLPARTSAQRGDLLRTAQPAIEYIGAIMAAHADIAASFHRDIRLNIGILTNEYQSRSLTQWRELLARKQPRAALVAGSDMAIWAQHNMAYLEQAVGVPDSLVFAGP